MRPINFIASFLLVFNFSTSLAQHKTRKTYYEPRLRDVVTAFQSIDQNPCKKVISTNLPIPNKSGHAQGIFLRSVLGVTKVYISGSSDTAGYMVSGTLDGDTCNLTKLEVLRERPFRHAGGMQAMGRYAAVGVEDNDSKTRSVIQFLRLGSKTTNLEEISRTGIYKRFTAGAVGITKWKSYILVCVANWDSKNLDFYRCHRRDFIKGEFKFELFTTITPKNLDKKKWVNDKWEAYQNVNLITQKNNKLFLIAFQGLKDKNESVADLYQLKLKKKQPLLKVACRKFKPEDGINFIWTAGINILNEDEFSIITSDRNLKNGGTIEVFEPAPNISLE